MDAQVETMISSFRMGYDALAAAVRDEEAKRDLIQVFERLVKIGETSPDYMSFVTKANEEKLFAKYSEASAKASGALMKQMQEDAKSGAPRAKPTLAQYLKTYEGNRDLYRTKPHMHCAVKVHEAYLALAKNFSDEDIPGFLAEAERRGYIVLLSLAAIYDEWAANLHKLDPHDTELVEEYVACAAYAARAHSGEEVDYLINREHVKYLRGYNGADFRRFLMLHLAGAILDYEMSKLSLFATGDFRNFLGGVLIARRMCRDWYEMMTGLGLDWDTVFANPYHRKLVTNQGFPLSDFMAVWESMHPDTLPTMKKILFEEILPMPPLSEVLSKPPAGIPAVPASDLKDSLHLPEAVAAAAKTAQPKAHLAACTPPPDAWPS